MLIKLFQQPFPYDSALSSKVRVAAFFGVFILVFLLAFKPFDLDQFSFTNLIFICSVYGFVTFVCVLLTNVFIPLLSPETFREESWTTGKQILLTAFIIIIVGLGNYLVSPLLVDTSLDLSDAIWFQGITLSIAIFPVVVFILIKQNNLLKKYSRGAEYIEKELQEQSPAEELEDMPLKQSPQRKIVLLGDYQNEQLELYIDDLYLVTSASNYIKIFHLKKDKLVYSILRSTLRKAEEVLLEHQNFYKCHRAYIINLDKVEHVNGNAQGYKVDVKDHSEPVPVSRTLNKEFCDRLLAFRKNTAST